MRRIVRQRDRKYAITAYLPVTVFQVNIRIDDELKTRAENIFEELGLNMTTAFTMFIRQTIRQGGIPFEITTRTDPFYNAENMRVLRRSIKEAEEGKLTAHELIEE